MRLYVYQLAGLERVVDGDTYDLHVDVGFHARFSSRFRLNGWDTPELRRGSDHEKEMGRVAKEYVEQWFDSHPLMRLRVRTHKADSFGRWLCDLLVISEGGTTYIGDLGQDLADQQLATKWPVRWREVYDTMG